ncbi:GntR family transcriptional regulator [[Acholeplasma] multilocale]|uniref:GntR family transcriptional regulator n=1 Tax=[Acholeplasma] multilocale TaxID=264638 RepID=UPI000479E2DD|nr:GntR family transcriptional regulator [[Acholeplasma] multilocale]
MSITNETTELLLELIKFKFKPGDKFYSEAQLITKYRVSRLTIRNALKMLAAQNIIYSKKGKGYYVMDSSVWRKTISFSERHNVTSGILVKTNIELDKYFVEKYKCDNNDYFSCIKVRYVGESLHKYSIIWINKKIAGSPDWGLIDSSVLKFLKNRDVALTKSEKRTTIEVADMRDENILHIKNNENIPVKRSASFNDLNEIVECSTERYIPEQFELLESEVF